MKWPKDLRNKRATEQGHNCEYYVHIIYEGVGWISRVFVEYKAVILNALDHQFIWLARTFFVKT